MTLRVQEFIDEVVNGTRPHCRWVKLAVKRYLDDLEHGAERGLHFDEADAIHAIEFFKYVKHSKGEWAGQVFELEPWEQFIISNVFGWKNKNGLRRFKTSYLEVARKNGKTTLLAGLGNYLFLADGEPGNEIYSVATKLDQAKISYQEAVRMIKGSPLLKKRVNFVVNNMSIIDTASKFEPLGADADTLDGLNIHGAIIDELHAHKTSAVWDVINTATGARRQPLIFAITTAGFNKESVCWKQHEYLEKVLEGVLKDDTFFGMIFSIDKDDNWFDEEVWKKANPNLGVCVKIEDMRALAVKAREMPSELNSFLRLKLNVWTESETRWFTKEIWDACAGHVDENALAGKSCFAGLDLSSTRDVTAWVLVFSIDGKYKVLWRFFIPQDNMAKRISRDRVPYDVWVREGYVTATPGNVIDYAYVFHQIDEDAKKFDIKQTAYDPWGASKIAPELQAHGMTLVEFRQGYKTMSPASKDFERLLLAKTLEHGGNPVANWMASNVVIKEDEAGNIKPDKALALDTLLVTPYGWKILGNIEKGDILFDENGKQCKVINVTDIRYGQECYKISFDIGDSLVVDAGHEWGVFDVKAFGIQKKIINIKTTIELSKDIVYLGNHKQYRYSIPLTKPLELEEQEFILDPYILGCWLGDGSTSSCYIISADNEIFEYFNNHKVTHANCCPCKSNACLYYVDNLVPLLHEMKILNRKRIPDGYLRGNIVQRLSLLQGLMDTDGHIACDGGFSTFVNTNKNLIDGVYELLLSLGYKANIKENIARCKMKLYGPVWKVTFTARKDMPPFRLKRKAELIPDDPDRRARGKTRQITNIEKINTVPVRCIQVDSPSNLFLAGKSMIPTHNCKSSEKIDGIVALIMGVDLAIKAGNKTSIYESRGVLSF